MTPRIPRTPAAAAPFSFAFAALLTLLSCVMYALVLVTVAGLSGAPLLADVLALLYTFGNSLAIALRRFPQPLHTALALRPAPLGAWLAPFLLVPSLLLFSELHNLLVALLPAAPPAAEAGSHTPVELALIFTGLIVVTPIASEAFFRGFVFGQLAALWGGPRAVFASSLLSWAFATLSPQLVLFLIVALVDTEAAAGASAGAAISLAQLTIRSFGAALLLGIVRHSSGSLYPAVLLAALFGAVDFVGYLRALHIPGFDDMSAAHTPAGWLLPALLLTGAGLWLCHRVANRAASGSASEA